MPRLSDIEFRNMIGRLPKSRMTKEQKKIIEDNNLKPSLVEYYFGRRCEYYDTHKPPFVKS